MADIKIIKQDDVYMKILTERSIEYELYEEFSFWVHNAQFMPAFKKKIWDGYVKLYDTKSKTLYLGLYRELKDFAHHNGYSVEFEGFDDNYPNKEFTPTEIKEFVDSLNLSSNGKPISIRDYQLYTVYQILNHMRRIILSATSSGKTLSLYVAVQALQSFSLIENKILLVVPNITLANQMYADFEDYASEIEWDVDDNVHVIKQGNDKETDKPIVISTWQAIYSMPEEYFEQFDAVFVDEVHLAQSKSLQGIMSKLKQCPYKIGVTGTLDESKTNEMVLKGLFGKIKQVASTKELMKREQVAELEIRCLIIQYPQDECKYVQNMKYQEEIDYIINHEKRNNLIGNITKNQESNSLVLFNKIDHGRILEEIIENKETNHDVCFISGEIDGDTREEIRQHAEENKTIVVASFGTSAQGMSINNINNVIFASPSKSKIRTLQSIGRGLRKNNESKVVLYDIVDDFRGNYSKKNFALKHFEERLKHYINEEFKYFIKKVNIDNVENN